MKAKFISLSKSNQSIKLFVDIAVNNYFDWILLSIKISLIIIIVYVPILLTHSGFRDLILRFKKMIEVILFKKNDE